MTNIELIDKLNAEKALTKAEWVQLIGSCTASEREYAAGLARAIAQERFGKRIYYRGIIEFSNYCKNNCLYCGIRAGNACAVRYRLQPEDILECCRAGHELGFRTFVLQGGEDPYYTDELICSIVRRIKAEFPDCAVTLSIGEKPRESYRLYREAGADRYLLRHETANAEHYAMLHPAAQSFEARMRCLRDLRELGYQVGCGMMIGSPHQTAEHLAEDMLFIAHFKPEMVGTGPFIPHSDTPLREYPAGSTELTLLLLSLTRIMLPDVLLPATTALGTVQGNGRQLGVLAGANVIMPNLSPMSVRKKYMLYDNKAITGDDAAESIELLRRHMQEIGYELYSARGDHRKGATE